MEIYYTGGATEEDKIKTILNAKQDVSNLVTAISSSSTDSQYPSAKCVYDKFNNLAGDEIPEGTVTEGKFSDMQEFFDSLEGKFCKGAVTYKITENETIDDLVNFYIPKWNIGEVIIDGNEKSITISNENVYSVQFFPYSSLENNQNTDYNYNNLKQSITLKNLTITTSKNGITNHTGCSFMIDSCTINVQGTCITSHSGLLKIINSEIEGSSSSSSTWTKGIVCDKGGILLSSNNIINTFYAGIFVNTAGFVKSFSDTFTNCGVSFASQNGGFGIGCTSSSTNILTDTSSTTGTKLQYGFAYKLSYS